MTVLNIPWSLPFSWYSHKPYKENKSKRWPLLSKFTASLLYILLKSWLCCCLLTTLATQQLSFIIMTNITLVAYSRSTLIPWLDASLNINFAVKRKETNSRAVMYISFSIKPVTKWQLTLGWNNYQVRCNKVNHYKLYQLRYTQEYFSQDFLRYSPNTPKEVYTVATKSSYM